MSYVSTLTQKALRTSARRALSRISTRNPLVFCLFFLFLFRSVFYEKMKQLLSSCDDSILVALGKKAYFFSEESDRVAELLKASNNQSSEKTNTAKNISFQDLDDILAVAVSKSKIDSTENWCAVARCDKTLAIYRIKQDENLEKLEYTVVYNTPKRVGQLCFAELPTGQNQQQQQENLCIVAGDLAGDIYAYCLTENRTRLLAGHTASMLTGVNVLGNRLISSDRDEKIRVSSFPESYILEGYLLGHTEYISSMDSVVISKGAVNLVTSCGGDRTLRLWDLDTMQQLSEISLHDEFIPSFVAFHPEGQMVTVIYDQSNLLHVYSVEEGESGKPQFGNLVKSLECPSQPLGIVFQSDETLLVLLKESQHLVSYKIDGQKFELSKSIPKKLQEITTAQDITMPENILERDEYGNIKLKKLTETRGASNAIVKPWNRVERVDVAKKRNIRMRKRKRERQREEKNKAN